MGLKQGDGSSAQELSGLRLKADVVLRGEGPVWTQKQTCTPSQTYESALALAQLKKGQAGKPIIPIDGTNAAGSDPKLILLYHEFVRDDGRERR